MRKKAFINMTSCARRHLLMCLSLFGAASYMTAAEDGGQPYIWDYYDNGISAEAYVLNYKGEAYNGPHTVTATGQTKIEAEDFDNGGEGISYNFKNHKSNNYRPDISDVAINGHGSGYVIGNVSGGDWLCYTIEVEDEGEYLLTVSCSSDNVKTFYYEVDGKSAGRIIKTPGLGWDTYRNVENPGLQLSKGRHIIRWVPSNSMNVDWFTLERTGDYNPDASGSIVSFEYPRYGTYTHNPLFTDLTSPMYGCGFTGNLYTADPSAHVWNIDGKDVLYVYASHDMEPAVGCDRMDRYHIFSTEDLVHWTDHGEVMNAATSNKYTGTDGEGFMWAPDCAYNPHDGLYYFVYPHKTADGEWKHFLATSPNPAGPFRCIGYIKGIPSTIDPCLFVDDDGEVYIYTSGGVCGSWGGKLKRDNWLELDGEMKALVGPDGTPESGFDDFHEAPWMFKRDGRYYLCHSDCNPNNNRLRYSVSDSPLGVFRPMGIYQYPHGHDTAHGSVVEFNGKWYSFYHTADFSAAGNLRSVCFDELTFADDGRINVVNTWGQPAGGNAVELSLAADVTLKAGQYNDGGNGRGYYVRGDVAPDRASSVQLDSEEWLRYTVNVKEKGRYAVTVRLRQKTQGSRIALAVNGEWKIGENGMEMKENTVDRWQELYIFPVVLSEGEQYIELRVRKGMIEIDEITVSAGQTLVPGVIQAEDLDADDYLFHDESAAKSQHSYRDEVWVAFGTGNGAIHIGNTSSGDYFNYTFNCTRAGVYKIATTLAVSAADSEYKITIDGRQIADRHISGSDWSKWFDDTVKGVELAEGVHKMRFDVVRGPMNIDKFTFTRTGSLAGIDNLFLKEPSSDKVDVYSLDGRLLKRRVDGHEALAGLARGLYIVGGNKIVNL